MLRREHKHLTMFPSKHIRPLSGASRHPRDVRFHWQLSFGQRRHPPGGKRKAMSEEIYALLPTSWAIEEEPELSYAELLSHLRAVPPVSDWQEIEED